MTLDWQSGFSLTEGADPAVIWQYKFSQLRGSSDDGKSKLKLHFQDQETRSIETKVSTQVSFAFLHSFASDFQSMLKLLAYLLYFGLDLLQISFSSISFHADR